METLEALPAPAYNDRRVALDERRWIAEGVEDAAQADWLRREGCEQAQGYYFGRPMAAEAVAELLEKGR